MLANFCQSSRTFFQTSIASFGRSSLLKPTPCETIVFLCSVHFRPTKLPTMLTQRSASMRPFRHRETQVLEVITHQNPCRPPRVPAMRCAIINKRIGKEMQGTTQTQWQWKCKLRGKVENVWKMHGVINPDPSDHPSKNPFCVHPLKKQHVKRLERNEIRDKIMPTPVALGSKRSSKFQSLPSNQHGAVEHLSSFQDRV